jgi:ion channel-forming bestrophin family protein
VIGFGMIAERFAKKNFLFLFFSRKAGKKSSNVRFCCFSLPPFVLSILRFLNIKPAKPIYICVVMYILRNLSWRIIIRFAWKYIVFYLFWSTCIVLIHMFFHMRGTNLAIPFAPVSTIGVAVAFYLGFKNNQSYDRFWEARTAWGGIVNASRTWGNQVMSFVSDFHKKPGLSDVEIHRVHKRLIYRHIAYINALRLQLRKPTTFSNHYYGAVSNYHFGSSERANWEQDVKPFLSIQEYEKLTGVQNMPTQILRRQGEDLQELMEKDQLLDDFRHVDLMNTLRDFYNEQGRCERIKNTPFPRQYAYFSKVFTWVFVLMLPLALVMEFEKLGERFIWMVIPFTTVISWIFMTMEMAGDNSEDPFENFINDVPMTSLCRNIEIDLREMLGETELPPRIMPKDGILM